MLSDLNVRLVRVLSQVTRETDELIRSSALAVVAQCCETLRFAVHPFLEDIIQCLSALSRDPSRAVCTMPTIVFQVLIVSNQVRRGAIHVVTCILRGAGNDALAILDSHLRSLLRLVRFVEESDEDEVTRFGGGLCVLP
jgi:hypothetical protein